MRSSDSRIRSVFLKVLKKDKDPLEFLELVRRMVVLTRASKVELLQSPHFSDDDEILLEESEAGRVLMQSIITDSTKQLLPLTEPQEALLESLVGDLKEFNLWIDWVTTEGSNISELYVYYSQEWSNQWMYLIGEESEFHIFPLNPESLSLETGQEIFRELMEFGNILVALKDYC